MKRAFLLLLLALTALYGKLGYDLWTEKPYPASSPEGVLSDIAERVRAIPLQSAGGYSPVHPRNIRKEGRNLFLISDDVLYRFDTSGRLICRITDPGLICVAAYLIDPLREQLIVLGNTDEIHYYTYEGELRERKKPETQEPCRRMQAVAMYQDCIWTAEERLCSQGKSIGQRLVKYDISFREMESHRLISADLPDKPLIPLFADMDIAVEEDSGRLYAYAAPLHPGRLLRDSLLLKYRQSGIFSGGDDGLAFPLCFGRRFWFASSYDPDDASRAVFCFDRATNRSWQIKDGFEDDFYGTGSIAEWQAMDIYSRNYCFCKSGEAVKHISPSGNPVVFIVELKV
ncbi:MAG: 6-bladed beta-propeller [Tannerellaceae bacterium]|jgi:hypothetical protein|nr:6-bladed beta-propeller [Tannerellaceae bacterium]